jgi:HTH-type transcriptional regulator/antitoxin HipB
MIINNAQDIAEFARRVRKSKHISQESLSRQVALRQRTISQFEQRPANCRIDTMLRVLRDLGLQIEIREVTSEESNVL